MNMIHLSDVRFAYPTEPDSMALDGLNCEIKKGELVGIVGPSGAGKTTLCRLIAGFVPHHFDGELTGKAVVNDMDIATTSIGQLAGSVGFVFETPFDQLTGANPTVYSEAAFSLENLGLPAEEIVTRVDEALELVDMTHLKDRHPARLSGGQCQRLALASILAMQPDILVLDEPTSQLDPLGAEEVLRIVSRMHERGYTILVSTQDLNAIAPFADRLISMSGGKIVDDGDVRSVLTRAVESGAQFPIPEVVTLAAAARDRGLVREDKPLPLSLEQAVAELSGLVGAGGVAIDAGAISPVASSDVVQGGIEIRDVTYGYPGTAPVFSGLDLTMGGGCICLLGQNGAGKSTLSKLLNGLLQPHTGSVTVDGIRTSEVRLAQVARHVGLAFQNPDEQLFKSSVSAEVGFGPKNMGYEAERIDELVEDALRRLELEQHRDRRPQELSLAERKRVAVASVVAMDTPIVVLDEPTGAQDLLGTSLLGRLVDELAAAGRLVVVITHDVEFTLRHATRIVALHSGEVLLDGPVHEVFAETEKLARTHVYPPMITRVGEALGLGRPVYGVDELLDSLAAAPHPIV